MITTQQKKWTQESGWQEIRTAASGQGEFSASAQLVLAFGSTSLIKDPKTYGDIKSQYPNSNILLCSTAGEILDTKMSDDTIVLSALHFDKTTLKFGQTTVKSSEESYEAGKKLASSIPSEGLIHAMVFSDGQVVNGTELVKGLTEILPKTIAVTGGLVGDGANFEETYVGLDAPATQGNIVVIGFYGDSLKVGFGSLGGWDPFGVERKITKSKGNVLYELDGQAALDLYKQYLGDKAKDLPSSGLLFPLSIRTRDPKGTEVELVRTLLSVNEADKSITFAGDIPEGVYAKLMKANFERLIDGASGAANLAMEKLSEVKPDVAILVSCIGRKLVLKERTEDELDAVRSKIGPQAAMIGFYSYGEICPTAASENQCELHNQTMTITTLHET